MSKELKRFEQWWDAEDDIPNNGPYTPDTPIQFAWAGWQAALAEQPAQKRPQNCGTSYCSCIECVMEPEQPAQQEPVAVVKSLPLGHGQTEMHYTKCQHLPVGTLLYTSPQAQREWVGLTDEEIKKLAAPLFMTHYWKLCNEFARAIEAKLKELNQ